jgi:flavin reductase (DIM6/NTAB) family NADH-FMN oxidoreductase RutF
MTTLGTPLISARFFREAFARIPASVSVLFVGFANKQVLGLTCTSAGPLSADPPMVIFCIDTKTGVTGLIRETSAFSVNYLAADRVETADAFAGRNKGLAVPHSVTVPGRTGVATLTTGTIMVLECRLAECYRGGDHDIITGHIVHARIQPDQQALLYGERSYAALTHVGKE